MQNFPQSRLRRLRQTPWIRELVREAQPTPSDLIWAIVVHDGDESEIPIASMPDAPRFSVKRAAQAAKDAQAWGIPAIAIFPFIDPKLKDPLGREATNPHGLVARTIQAMKSASPGIGIICDVALDPFTDHGHDGILQGEIIDNDATIEHLIAQSLMQVAAGADIIAPSDMMDGRIGAIRKSLDAANHADTLILAYSAKYASAFYGPYRDAIGSAKALKGDKKTYQMDPGNGAESLRETALDIREGADIIMVKPGLPYLDIVFRLKQEFHMPTFVFQVSGEYAQIKAASRAGWIDEDRAILETLTSFKRAGADAIITYFAPRAAQLMG